MNYEVFAVFIVYFAIVLTVGFYFYKRSESMSDYFLGGRSMNPYVTALSAQASDMSSWLLMGLPGAVILFGLGEAWIGIGLAIGSYLSWLFVAKRLRKHSVVAGDSTTVPEFFSNRYNDRKGILRIMSAVIILFFFTIYVASGFKGCGLILNTVVPDISLEIAMLVGAVIIIGYTFMGGFKAVCWTDFFQGMLMLVAVVAVPLAAISALGGWDGVVANLDSVAFISGADEFLNIFHDGGTALAAVTVLSLLAWGMGYFGMPHIVVRYMAIRHPDEIKISRRVSLIWIVIALTAAILIGIIGRAYFPTTDFAADGTAEQIFISLAGALFTPLVAGVLFAAVMAAIMSTADSQLLVASSSITNDMLAKTRFGLSEKGLMWVSRGVVIAVAVVAGILASTGGDSIMGLVSYAWAGFGAAFGPLMILSLYWKRMNLCGAVAAMAAGFATIVVWHLFLASTGIYELLPGFILSAAAGIIVSLLTGEPDASIVKDFDDALAYEEQHL